MPEPPKNIKLSAKEIVNSLPTISYKDYLNYKPEPKRNFPVNLNLSSTGNLKDVGISGRLDIPLSERLNLNLNAGKSNYRAGLSYKFHKGGTIPKHNHPHDGSEPWESFEDKSARLKKEYQAKQNTKAAKDKAKAEELRLSKLEEISTEDFNKQIAQQDYQKDLEETDTRGEAIAETEAYEAEQNYQQPEWMRLGYKSADDYYDMLGDRGKYSYASAAKSIGELTAKKIKEDPMGALHMGLDIGGMTPGLGIVPDLINAGLYGLEGDWENVGYSSSAAIPLAGLFATPAKYVRKGYQKLKPKNLFKSNTPKLVDQTQIKNIANDPMVQVYTSDGSVKMMPKSQAIRLNRVEDANMDLNKLHGYESGNWFASEPLDFYNRKTKRGLDLSGEHSPHLLNPDEPRRLFTTYMDPEDAVPFNVFNSSQRAKNMSGGMGDPIDYEFILAPDMVNRMRKIESGPGFNVQYGNYDDIGKYMDEFYKRFGGYTYATGGAFPT